MSYEESRQFPGFEPFEIRRLKRNEITPEVALSYGPKISDIPTLVREGITPEVVRTYNNAGFYNSSQIARLHKAEVNIQFARACIELGERYETGIDIGDIIKFQEIGATLEEIEIAARRNLLQKRVSEREHIYYSGSIGY